MKKVFMLVVALSIIGVFMSCKAGDNVKPASNKQKASEKQSASNEQKDSDKPEFFVIDSNKASGNLADNIRLYNRTTRTGISFTVYLRDPKDDKWKEYGVGNLKGPGDTDFISSKLSRTLKNYRYYAIQPREKRSYRYEFEKQHNDLYIYIYDKK